MALVEKQSNMEYGFQEAQVIVFNDKSTHERS